MSQSDRLDQAGDTPEPPSPELLAKVQDLLSNVELLDVRPCAISASIERGVAPGAHVSVVEMDLGLSFAANKGVFSNLFDYSFELKGDAESEILGRVTFSLLLDYDVAEEYEPDREAADFVTATTGYFAAYPYARELFQSLAERLQFDPIVLGLLKRGQIRPGAVSVTPRQIFES
jgi:hypothetical protein